LEPRSDSAQIRINPKPELLNPRSFPRRRCQGEGNQGTKVAYIRQLCDEQ